MAMVVMDSCRQQMYSLTDQVGWLDMRMGSRLAVTLIHHIKSQIPLRYLVADRFEAGRGPVADLLARASSLLAS